MPKKQLPKRVVPFKLEKHPTAERLERLRSQGIESVEDLERLGSATNAPTPTPTSEATQTTVGGRAEKGTAKRREERPSAEATARATAQAPAGATEAVPPIEKGEAKQLLRASHSPSAHVIYQLLGELAAKRGRDSVRVGTKELLAKTEIKSHVTIRKAIDELIVKRSIEIIEPNQGKIPPVYRVYDPVAILGARREAGIVIDEDTKFATCQGSRIWPAGEPLSVAPQGATPMPTARATDRLTPVANSREIRNICEQLDVRVDERGLEESLAYPLPHVIIGICRTVERRPARVTLSDCIAEIGRHYESMRAFPDSLLAQVAYENFARIVKRSD